MSRRRKRGVRLEMTSLLDVIFLILVFFIYCIFDMTVHRGLKVDLPTAEGSPEVGERIVITILPDDTLQFNGVFVAQDEAIARVLELRRTGTDLPVLVSGDRNASLGKGIELLSALKSAGVEHATFQVSEAAP